MVPRCPSPVATEEYTENEKWDDYAEGEVIEATVISRNPRPVDTESIQNMREMTKRRHWF